MHPQNLLQENRFSPILRGFSFSIQLITFFLFCILLRRFQESFGILKAPSTEITAFLGSSYPFGVWSFESRKKTQPFLYMKKTKNQNVASEEGSYFSRRCKK